MTLLETSLVETQSRECYYLQWNQARRSFRKLTAAVSIILPTQRFSATVTSIPTLPFNTTQTVILSSTPLATPKSTINISPSYTLVDTSFRAPSTAQSPSQPVADLPVSTISAVTNTDAMLGSSATVTPGLPTPDRGYIIGTAEPPMSATPPTLLAPTLPPAIAIGLTCG